MEAGKDEEMTTDDVNALDDFLIHARAIARIHGYGFGKQPPCWPKAEERWFAEWFLNGKFDELRQKLRDAYKEGLTE